MPKIVYRPNPTPPPFPPPSPVYPANSLKITPYPFEAYNSCNFNIINLQEINDSKSVNLLYTRKTTGEEVTFEVLSLQGSTIKTSFEKIILDNSDNIVSFFVSVTPNEGKTYNIPLTLV